MDEKNSRRFLRLRHTLSWENIIVMIVLFPTMFILIHWSFKEQPLPDYVKEIIVTLLEFILCPIVASKGFGNHIFSNFKINVKKKGEDKIESGEE